MNTPVSRTPTLRRKYATPLRHRRSQSTPKLAAPIPKGTPLPLPLPLATGTTCNVIDASGDGQLTPLISPPGGADATPAPHRRQRAHQLSGLFVASLLLLLDAVPFGLIMLPASLRLPDGGDARPLGISLFLLCASVSQIVYAWGSGFDCAISSVIVENVPFLTAIGRSVARRCNGDMACAVSTTLASYALSSLLVGAAFLVMGRMGVGKLVSFFPRHILIGCIGGIGVFMVSTAIGVAIGTDWEWSGAYVSALFTWPRAAHWLAPLLAEFLLRALARLFDRLPAGLLGGDARREAWRPLLAPAFFLLMLPGCYACLAAAGLPTQRARQLGWLFERPAGGAGGGFAQVWQLLDFSRVDWGAPCSCWTDILALVAFSLLHVPINIPSLAITTGQRADIDRELIAHGWSNIASTLCGSALQNYLCFTNAALYHKSGGGGRVPGAAVGIIGLSLFFAGTSFIQWVPRTLAATLMLHLGVDLLQEACVDCCPAVVCGTSAHEAGERVDASTETDTDGGGGVVDWLEYASILAITIAMPLLGFLEGFILGIIAACAVFVAQAGAGGSLASPPSLDAAGGALCSRKAARRGGVQRQICSKRLRLRALRLSGHLFFGNVGAAAAHGRELVHQEVRRTAAHRAAKSALEPALRTPKIRSRAAPLSDLWAFVFDFTLVSGCDCTAAATLQQLATLACDNGAVVLCVGAARNHGVGRQFNIRTASRTALSGAGIRTPPSRPLSLADALHASCVQGQMLDFDTLDAAFVFWEDIVLERANVPALGSLMPRHHPHNQQQNCGLGVEQVVADDKQLRAALRHLAATDTEPPVVPFGFEFAVGAEIEPGAAKDLEAQATQALDALASRFKRVVLAPRGELCPAGGEALAVIVLSGELVAQLPSLHLPLVTNVGAGGKACASNCSAAATTHANPESVQEDGGSLWRVEVGEIVGESAILLQQPQPVSLRAAGAGATVAVLHAAALQQVQCEPGAALALQLLCCIALRSADAKLRFMNLASGVSQAAGIV